MNNALNETNFRLVTAADQLVYGKIIEPETGELLLPVIVVDSQTMALEGIAAIRMQGYANYAAVEQTFETGLVTFWSRSKKGLWVKGMSSGNTLSLRAAYTDCDADSLLVDAAPAGPTCHTGAQSCFQY